ncbi:uncharacterized protein N7498_006823 [Penicillium cinerascens]|uniref:C2H2-type domain-containing protein n=1 Tax=Penicillium cinerascens TaxID=70096 RepID=A0A9W9SY45_9EURO|nr:uncharacterized protein N7498_006823 [Penicillium cinerascens]KAJ5202160.1 hypothetical protein N7498_006823 [Penicillium cinerascens]
MDNHINAHDYFIYNPTYHVAICKKCGHAVVPRDIIGHLSKRRGDHYIPESVAQRVKEIIIDEWDEVHNEPGIFPTQVEQPIAGLTVHTDGIKCSFCVYVCRSPESIRKHWRVTHQFSPYQQSRKPRPSETAAGQEKRDQAMQRVVCQRFFRSKFGSHYIHVRHPSPACEPAAPPPQASRVAQAIDKIEAIFAQQRQQPAVIQAGEIDEANLWLDRTGWARYLYGQTPKVLRICVESPADDAEGPEATVGAHRHIEHPIEAITGVYARARRVRAPRRAVPAGVDVFCADRIAWDALWRAAQCLHAGRPVQNPIDGGDDQPHRLEPVEARCMDFVIELLNQRIQSSEYECAFVYALAVLGVSDHEGGRPWKDPHSYPLILSSMIKVSRFVIVHKVYLLDPDARELF